MSRSAKPKLTVDTRAHTKPNVDQLATQSAPVLARQERGIPHIHQAVDRNCKKVSEMMNSPTWRSQRPGPKVVDDSTPSEQYGLRDAYTPDSWTHYVDDDEEYHSNRGDKDANEVLEGFTRQCVQRRHADSGISVGRDADAMSILGIHSFTEIPDSPANTFVISAAVSNGASHFREAIYGQLHSVVVPRMRADIQSEDAEADLASELMSEDEYLGSHETGFHSSPRSISHGSSQSQNEAAPIGRDVLESGEKKQNMDRDIHQLMERDEAIKSVNSKHASPRRNRRPDPEDRLRFQGLLGRLRCEAEALADDRTDKITLNDPAIVSFAPKKSAQRSANNELAARLQTEEKKRVAQGRHHASSDSGYASPSTQLRPNNCTLSRSRHGTSDEIDSGPPVIQHSKVGSKDSEPDRSSKSSTLNPAAKVFSSANAHSDSPRKRGGLAPAYVTDRAFSSPLLPQAHFGTGVQLQNLGYNALPNLASPLTNLALAHSGLLQPPTALMPQSGPFPQVGMPPPPGLGLAANLASSVQNSATLPGLPLLHPPCGMGLPGLTNSPGLMPISGSTSSELMGAFHQQLPANPSCNNPAHQSASAFSVAQGYPTSTPPQLPPPAPPASLLSPIHRGPVAPVAPVAPVPPVAPVAPVVNPIFRKNVPKPRVPNTTGQQYWEYWHELRRTFEPGYAQKSKQNQQKRYMKQQTHKSGGATNQT